MNYRKSQIYFFAAIFLIVLAFTLVILRPYFGPLVLAGVFAVIFSPLNERFLVFTQKHLKWRKGGVARAVAPVLTLTVFLLVLLVPLVFIGFQMAGEIGSLYGKISGDANFEFLNQVTVTVESRIKDFIPGFSLDLESYARRSAQWFAGNLNALFQGAGNFVIGTFLFLFALYYFLKDGRELKDFFLKASPLPDEDDEKILHKMKTAVNSIIRGSLAVAVIQGILTGIGFVIFGIPNPSLWGSIAAVSALIPTVGTALVLLPGILYLFLTGEQASALGLLIWGTAAVGTVDNFMGPYLMKQGIPIHPFLILLSVLGGLSFFGPLGFLIGPLVISLFYALFDIYAEIIEPKKEKIG